MKLKEFIEKFVEPNTLIRLHYKIKGGHKKIKNSLSILHTLKDSRYVNRKVIGVIDILHQQGYYNTEAVNLVIER